MIGFRFTSDWSRKWHEFFNQSQSVVKQPPPPPQRKNMNYFRHATENHSNKPLMQVNKFDALLSVLIILFLLLHLQFLHREMKIRHLHPPDHLLMMSHLVKIGLPSQAKRDHVQRPRRNSPSMSTEARNLIHSELKPCES